VSRRRNSDLSVGYYLTTSCTVVECWVEAELPVIVIVEVVEPGPPLPPQAD